MRAGISFFACAVLAGCSAPFSELTTPNSTLVLREGIPLFEVAPGSPEERGRWQGRALARAIETLQDEIVDVANPSNTRTQELLPHIPAVYRQELQGIAQGAGVSFQRLLFANVTVDRLCTAVAAWGPASKGPLILGRNMDFEPADVLGPYTYVTLHPAQGPKLAFASVSWPGFNGVVSGLNEAGVCAVVLLNSGSNQDTIGTPLAYRVREILEGARTLAEAQAILSATPVASDHYVLVADANEAALFFQRSRRGEEPEIVRLDGQNGLLLASNGASDPNTGLILDPRTRCLSDVCGARPLGAEHLRAALGAAFLRGINCQSMLFRPADLVLQLATGDAGSPASRERWVELDLKACLAGEGLKAVTARALKTPAAPAHYQLQDYEGRALSERLALAYTPRFEAARRIEASRERIARVSEFSEQLWAATGHAPYRQDDPVCSLLREAAESNRADLTRYLATLAKDPEEADRVQRILTVECLSNPTPSYQAWLQAKLAQLGD